MADINYQTDQIFDEKSAQQKIADDEYYAGLQSFFERDPIVKEYFNVDDITYPAMEKSGNYNYRGFYTPLDLGGTKKYLKKRGIDKIISPESTFIKKVEKGEAPIAILEEPISTGSEPGDLEKIRTILHESRHKAFDKNPEYRNFILENSLDEEVFNRFLDIEIFPEFKTYAIEQIQKRYSKGYEDLKNQYEKAAKKFLKRFKKKSSIKDQITNLFN